MSSKSCDGARTFVSVGITGEVTLYMSQKSWTSASVQSSGRFNERVSSPMMSIVG